MAPVIELENITLWRRTQEEFHYDLKRTVFALLRNSYRRPQKRQVLSDVTLSIEPGAKFGIIGANGSGKSTLLKVLCRILKPTSGRVHVDGRIAPLIELGAGFETDLSVVDNIVYYGVLLGISREAMLTRIDPILDFAELQAYRVVPVKALSSGMVARLGFAIATDVRPEILILDEVLSVGDESFRQKCEERLRGFWDAHSTVIVVSHDMSFILESCETVAWLDNGRLARVGPAAEVVSAYLASVHGHAGLSVVPFDAFVELERVRLDDAHPCAMVNVDSLVARLEPEPVLEVGGWAGYDAAGTVADEAYLVLDGRYALRLAYGQERPDVAAALGIAELERSGFGARAPLPALASGPHEVRVLLRRLGSPELALSAPVPFEVRAPASV
ncbi:MAG: lipopolysaccharide transport system ATP-binding protein [Candidatus Eremiobacteraeota bacterium]|jgi:ABC-type polysaccharide/polyol phosphate transport system ATPase subunit|nr:lipopolysaccharide transport system ATP-binding protein [Candidatus Eremiobacteraeota bacterium]